MHAEKKVLIVFTFFCEAGIPVRTKLKGCLFRFAGGVVFVPAATSLVADSSCTTSVLYSFGDAFVLHGSHQSVAESISTDSSKKLVVLRPTSSCSSLDLSPAALSPSFRHQTRSKEF
jgi:hypothetical protein